jgi:hypothetical protein
MIIYKNVFVAPCSPLNQKSADFIRLNKLYIIALHEVLILFNPFVINQTTC